MKKDELEKLSQILTFFKKEEITRQHILDFIKTFAIKSARGNENAFFFITDRYVDDIGHLETQLLEDFSIFSSEYDLVVKDDSEKKYI